MEGTVKVQLLKGNHFANDILIDLKDRDILVTLGPTKCAKYLFGIFNANDVNELKDFIEEDIYWEKGIWINYDIYPWIQAF